MSTSPTLAIDEETAIVAEYMKAKFAGVLRHHSSAHPPSLPDFTVGHPRHWSLDFSMEVDLALDVIARAFHNTGILFITTKYSGRVELISTKFQQTGMPNNMPIVSASRVLGSVVITKPRC
jgi:hypothetical protein